MPWYEGMGLFQNIAENLVDLVPSSITNAISDTVIDMDADGNQQKARDYEEALKRGENPPPPAGMPEDVIQDSKSAAGSRSFSDLHKDEGFDLPMDDDMEQELALADNVKLSSGGIGGT
jgi:hypothetical protein